MERVKKQKSISKIFAIYIMFFCIATILLAIFDFILFQIGLDSGFILPANYYEQKIEKQREEIAKAEGVKVKDFIPDECNYIVYDSIGNVFYSNVSETKAIDIWNLVQSDKRSEGKYYYKVILRENGICVVEYTIGASFVSPVLKKYVQNAELSFVCIYFVLFSIEIIILSRCFRRRISKELHVLKETTENIQMENLEFEVKYSNILEINEVISALDKMKTELNDSLSKQWKMEEARKEQIAALAHDIKTPLTIIKGNSELLSELDLKEDQAEFNDSILNEIKNIEDYIKSLIEIMKTEKESILEKKKIKLEEFIQDIIEQGISIGINKKVEFKSEIKHIPEFIIADESALKRTLSNVISNSVEYCSKNGKMVFGVDSDDDNIRFTIEDSGRGFTEEELQLATDQFFQGDKSRNSKNHYGMGLYIAKKFMEKHNGNISLGKSEKLGGAKVVIELPILYN
ncbi:HAMP domain-containing sensor histidine kinase [Clostridium beijerinckii]|uniref:HAMP domain-containing sensor histidine kinase n=1 Tax=Clostridium beijerinckii TaxID=1520 RepID=UPI000809AD3E|nr:HAMP domain-containing sensor histidine kinase [Clostridium beijerinckii]OCB00659.1 two-component sensor histidine kinase [Clostridium beijerinckii]